MLLNYKPLIKGVKMLRITQHGTAEIRVKYKHNITKRVIELVNPSTAHLKRLASCGHDLDLSVYVDGVLVKQATFKY